MIELRMEDKIPFDTFLKQDLLLIPEPDLTFMLGEYTIPTYPEIVKRGGVYIFSHSGKILYVGCSKGLDQRISKHKNKKSEDNFKGKLMANGFGEFEANNFIRNVKVEIIFVEEESRQEFLEIYLIQKMQPVFNIQSTEPSKLAVRSEVSDKIIEEKDKLTASKKISIDTLFNKQILSLPVYDTIVLLKPREYRHNPLIQEKGGLYAFFNGNEVLYVGITNNYVSRFDSHRGQKGGGNIKKKLHEEGNDKQTIKSILNTWYVAVWPMASLPERQLLEKYIIGIYKPRYNDAGLGKRGSDGKQNFIKLPIKDMVYSYNNGESIRSLSKKYNVSETTINNRLRERNIPIRTTIKKIPSDELASDYLEGTSIKDLMIKYNVSRSTIMSRLNEKGIYHTKNYLSSSEKKTSSLLARQYENGASIHEIAEKTGYTAGKIRRYLILENVTIRRANFKGRVDKKRELSDNNQDLTLPEIEEMMRLRKEKPKRTWTTEEQQLIPLVVSCYSEGESIRPLAKRMGLSFNKARNMLLENGIEIRKGGGVPGVKKPIPEKQLLMIPKLVKEYKTHTLSELMKKHHLSSTRIRILLRMGGVTKFKTGPKKGKKSVLTEAEFNLIPLLIEEYKSVGIRELHRLHPQLSEVKIRRLLLLGRATIRVSGDNSRKIALSILE